jgi:hypothetical protein
MDAQARFVGRPHWPCSRNSSALIAIALAFVACAVAPSAYADNQRVAELEAQLADARARIGDLESTLGALAADVAALKSEQGGKSPPEEKLTNASSPNVDQQSDSQSAWRKQILVPDLGADERDEELTARPTLFVQTGYAARPIEGAKRDDVIKNFTLTRVEAGWLGRVSDQLGMGFEIQYHPAPAGVSEELVNDAFIEYYANDAVTLRVGQFIKQFGFDVQHGSDLRESPERAMFAGYFFPGQRDRGAMVLTDLSHLGGVFEGMMLSGAVLNGNRFFNDDNGGVNVNLRFRKVFESFAVGASLQTGSQLLPPGAVGSDRATIYGVDAQWVIGRLGIRAEYVHGDMPSTLLSLEPELAPAFEPGLKTSGAAAFFDYRFTSNDSVYWRADRLTDDPVSRATVRAYNVGYLRQVGDKSRIGIDYQWKNGVSFNDDKVNTQFAVRWSLIY